MIQENLLYILPSLGAGALAAFWAFKVKMRKQNESEFKTLLNEYKDMRKELLERVDALEEELASVREENAELRAELKILKKNA